MRVGIVGSEDAKFTLAGRRRAIHVIECLLSGGNVTEVVSGACHLGGIDVWAAAVGSDLGIIVTEFPPATYRWADGYKPRNLQIVERSDIVHCITVDELPKSYVGMRFERCYHCGPDAPAHIKSGGCWTMKQAIKAGKLAELHIIQQGVV